MSSFTDILWSLACIQRQNTTADIAMWYMSQTGEKKINPLPHLVQPWCDKVELGIEK